MSFSRVASKRRLVILGSGWGALNLIRKVSKQEYDVVVISPRNHFVFTPLLASCAVGTLEYRAILEPVRQYSREITFHQAWCDRIDFNAKTLHCMPAIGAMDAVQPFDVAYDKLVIAVGAYSNTFGIPGVKEHACFLKDIADARRIRARIIECFECASQPNIAEERARHLLHFVCVGAGPTGIEMAAEMSDMITDDLSRLYPALMPFVSMSVYDVSPSILGAFDQKLATYAMDRFRRRGISIKTSKHVDRVDAANLYIREDGVVPYGVLMWATGLMNNPLTESIKDGRKDARSGRLLTDKHLRLLKEGAEPLVPIPNVYALGDCATIFENPLPATAQVANQKSIYLTKALNRIAKSGDSSTDKPFDFNNLGIMAYIGGWKAVVDMSTKNKQGTYLEQYLHSSPLAEFVALAKQGGTLAWLFWRSSYLTMTVSLRNKILIPMYWFLTWLLGRDINRF